MASLVLISIFMFLNGCVSKEPRYSPASLEIEMQQGKLNQKTDRLAVVIDGQGDLDLQSAYDILQGIRGTIPSRIDYEKIFRVYGWNVESFSDEVAALFRLHQVPYQGIEELVVTRVLPESEIIPLSITLDSLTMELSERDGNNALVIISNGESIDEEAVRSARYLKESLDGRICIYPVLMGDDQDGFAVLEKLSDIGGCGYLSRQENLLTADGMTDLVRDIFFTSVAPLAFEKQAVKEEPDLDAMLGEDKKIKFVLNVEFEFDKAVILPGFYDEMKEVADFLKNYPQTKALLVGHTDNKGPESYNRRLSLERARSVRRYLVENYGIEEGRLSVKGMGESRPVADNSSVSGRQRNRRVVAVISRQVKEFSSAE